MIKSDVLQSISVCVSPSYISSSQNSSWCHQISSMEQDPWCLVWLIVCSLVIWILFLACTICKAAVDWFVQSTSRCTSHNAFIFSLICSCILISSVCANVDCWCITMPISVSAADCLLDWMHNLARPLAWDSNCNKLCCYAVFFDVLYNSFHLSR